MQKTALPKASGPRVRGWWLITSGVALIAALAAPLYVVPHLRDPDTAAAWVVVVGVILNGAGMAIRAGVHGAPRGSRLAWMDGAGKVLSLVGWSSALVFVGFNAFEDTPPGTIRIAAQAISYAAVGIGGALVLWGGVLLIWSQRPTPAPADRSRGLSGGPHRPSIPRPAWPRRRRGLTGRSGRR